MLLCGNILALVGYFLVVHILFSTAMNKMWIQNNAWESTENWNLGRLPCANDIVRLQENDAGIFINSSSTIRQLILPDNGSVVFGNFAELVFAEDHSSQECEGSEISFIGSGSDDWFDPNNWKPVAFNGLFLPHQHVPCEHDVVKFPEDSSYSVKVSKNVTVARVVIGEQEMSEGDFRRFISSDQEIQQISLEGSVSFHITGKECDDASGCICGNSGERDYICNFVTCPKLPCNHPVNPVGGCCSICGTLMLLHISDGFNKAVTERNLRNYLNEFPGLVFTAVKIEDRIVQVVLQDKFNEDSQTTRAAHAIRENLLHAKNSHIVKIEILSGESRPRKTSGSAVKTGLITGGSILFVVAMILLVVYLISRKRSRHSNPERNVGDSANVENPVIEDYRVNPLFELSVEMENFGFDYVLSPPDADNNEAVGGRENPMYEQFEGPSNEQ